MNQYQWIPSWLAGGTEPYGQPEKAYPPYETGGYGISGATPPVSGVAILPPPAQAPMPLPIDLSSIYDVPSMGDSRYAEMEASAYPVSAYGIGGIPVNPSAISARAVPAETDAGVYAPIAAMLPPQVEVPSRSPMIEREVIESRPAPRAEMDVPEPDQEPMSGAGLYASYFQQQAPQQQTSQQQGVQQQGPPPANLADPTRFDKDGANRYIIGTSSAYDVKIDPKTGDAEVQAYRMDPNTGDVTPLGASAKVKGEDKKHRLRSVIDSIRKTYDDEVANPARGLQPPPDGIGWITEKDASGNPVRHPVYIEEDGTLTADVAGTVYPSTIDEVDTPFHEAIRKKQLQIKLKDEQLRQAIYARARNLGLGMPSRTYVDSLGTFLRTPRIGDKNVRLGYTFDDGSAPPSDVSLGPNEMYYAGPPSDGPMPRMYAVWPLEDSIAGHALSDAAMQAIDMANQDLSSGAAQAIGFDTADQEPEDQKDEEIAAMQQRLAELRQNPRKNAAEIRQVEEDIYNRKLGNKVLRTGGQVLGMTSSATSGGGTMTSAPRYGKNPVEASIYYRGSTPDEYARHYGDIMADIATNAAWPSLNLQGVELMDTLMKWVDGIPVEQLVDFDNWRSKHRGTKGETKGISPLQKLYQVHESASDWNTVNPRDMAKDLVDMALSDWYYNDALVPPPDWKRAGRFIHSVPNSADAAELLLNSYYPFEPYKRTRASHLGHREATRSEQRVANQVQAVPRPPAGQKEKPKYWFPTAVTLGGTVQVNGGQPTSTGGQGAQSVIQGLIQSAMRTGQANQGPAAMQAEMARASSHHSSMINHMGYEQDATRGEQEIRKAHDEIQSAAAGDQQLRKEILDILTWPMRNLSGYAKLSTQGAGLGSHLAAGKPLTGPGGWLDERHAKASMKMLGATPTAVTKGWNSLLAQARAMENYYRTGNLPQGTRLFSETTGDPVAFALPILPTSGSGEVSGPVHDSSGNPLRDTAGNPLRPAQGDLLGIPTANALIQNSTDFISMLSRSDKLKAIAGRMAPPIGKSFTIQNESHAVNADGRRKSIDGIMELIGLQLLQPMGRATTQGRY